MRVAAVRGTAPDYMIFSVLMTVICLFFFSGLCIFLNVPALVFSAMVRRGRGRGEGEGQGEGGVKGALAKYCFYFANIAKLWNLECVCPSA